MKPSTVVSQVAGTPPSASNPASGIHNVLLQPGANGAGAQQDPNAAVPQQAGPQPAQSAPSMGLEPKELIHTLQQLAAAPMNEVQEYRHIIEQLAERSQDRMIKERLNHILNAMLMTADPKRQTKDPLTGKRDPTASELASELAQEVRAMQSHQKSSSNTYNLFREAQKAKGNKAGGEGARKKKTRGNPFRVLMGKVGKLLDHGLDKHDIVRYIAKEKKWNEDTIGKAVDIVRDYSKKKRRGEKKFQDTDEGSKVQHKASTTFNWNRYAAKADTPSIYEIKPDFTKRSTAELMARASWLQDLQEYGVDSPQGDFRKAADKEGVATELRSIRAALTARGFEPNELP